MIRLLLTARRLRLQAAQSRQASAWQRMHSLQRSLCVTGNRRLADSWLIISRQIAAVAAPSS
jgi:hypothetical protein